MRMAVRVILDFFCQFLHTIIYVREEFILSNICVCQKKAVPLSPISAKRKPTKQINNTLYGKLSKTDSSQ